MRSLSVPPHLDSIWRFNATKLLLRTWDEVLLSEKNELFGTANWHLSFAKMILDTPFREWRSRDLSLRLPR
jgi:hypothetical protein